MSTLDSCSNYNKIGKIATGLVQRTLTATECSRTSVPSTIKKKKILGMERLTIFTIMMMMTCFCRMVDPQKAFTPYFHPEPLPEILSFTNLQHYVSRV